jgi:hypothetical protein
MAAGARVEGGLLAPGLHRIVAAGARHLFVRAAQEESRPVMVELRAIDALPILLGVARDACGSEAPLMGIAMTGAAFPLEPEPAAHRIAAIELRSRRRDLEALAVAFDASPACMTAAQRPTGPSVVEAIPSLLAPADQVKVLPRMLGMATCACRLPFPGV